MEGNYQFNIIRMVQIYQGKVILTQEHHICCKDKKFAQRKSSATLQEILQELQKEDINDIENENKSKS